jgi:hypothetical protein
MRGSHSELTGALFGELVEMGVYVGEVLRREVGGEWVETRRSLLKGLTQMPYVVRLRNGATVNAIEKPLKRFEQGEGDSARALFEAVSLRVRSAPVNKPWWRFW